MSWQIAGCRWVHPPEAGFAVANALDGRKSQVRRTLQGSAADVGSASWVGGRLTGIGLLALGLALVGCAPTATERSQPAGDLVATGPDPSPNERYCAWYGDARAGTLYFGQAAFWSGFRARGGDPLADLDTPGPQWIGRFDLARGTPLSPLDVTAPGARSGVWDVYAHPNHRVYFTTFYEAMGWVDIDSGEVRHLDALGAGLNEIAPGPEGELLVSRYAGRDAGDGSILRISLDGEPVAELPVRAPAGFRSAPKTVAFDPGRHEIWVTTDLLADDGSPPRHDAFVLGLDGSERRRIERPELQFVAFSAAGQGARAEVAGRRLWLTRTRPGREDVHLLLDEGFERDLDFVQDLVFSNDGTLVVTRWSGAVHVVSPEDGVRTLELPALDDGGLYYTAVLADGRVCATYCGRVRVVCRSLEGAREQPARHRREGPLR